MDSKYLTIKKSIIDETPTTIRFGELALSDKDNILRVFCGDQTDAAVKIFDQSVPANNFVYNNDKQKYIAVNGSDDNNGQSGYPYSTVLKGLENITTGGIISLEAGIYNELLSFDETHSVRGIIGQNTCNIYNSTELSNGIEMYSSNNRMTFANLEFSSSTLDNHVDINSSSSTQNYNFDHITASGSTKTTSNIIRAANTGSSAGYININQCDFANRILKLGNSGLPRFCFITNSSNISLDAGTNWLVFIDDNSQIIELSNNNNIINSNTVNDFISVAPTTFGFYLLESDVTINSVLYTKGSYIVYSGVAVSFYSKYYRNKSSYYVINKNQTYVKTGSNEYSVITSYPIIL